MRLAELEKEVESLRLRLAVAETSGYVRQVVQAGAPTTKPGTTDGGVCPESCATCGGVVSPPPERESTQDLERRVVRALKEAAEITQEIDLDSGIADILDAMPEFVLLVDAGHRMLLANKAVCDALGKSRVELMGAFCPKTIHGLDHAFPGCPLEDSLRSGERVVKELYDSNHDMWVESAVYPTRYESAEGCRVYLHTARDITSRKRAEAALVANQREQKVLADLLRLSLEDLTLGQMLKKALAMIFEIPWLSIERRGAIFLMEESGEALTMKVQQDLSPALIESCKRIPLGYCLCGRAALSRKPVSSSCLTPEHDVRYEGIREHGHYCIPMLCKGAVVGVLNLYLPHRHKEDPEELTFLESIAGVLASVVARRRGELEVQKSLARVEQTLDATAHAVARIVESRDPYTAGHQQRVAHLACAIAGKLGLDADRVRGIHLAGSLHDVGKIAIPAEILAKPGKLTKTEFDLVKSHAEVGYEILKEIQFSHPIADMVRQHHEKLDGTGYPLGLKGDAILLESRILAVADVVEAVASHRPYRAALGIDKAIEIVKTGKGTQFDAGVVDACAELFEKGEFSFEG